MFSPDQYELVDFGQGRKLERFGNHLVDRPSPASTGIDFALPASHLRHADARYERDEGQPGRWIRQPQQQGAWLLAWQSMKFSLKPTDSGHVGIFPEQASNWQWVAEQVQRCATRKVLNLFAYTGGSTLAAAAAGAQVVHVDAAQNVVAWARANAQLSTLAEKPIRWIAEDARKFVERELKRGATYDAVILDPPSYGHGPRGEAWQIEPHLDALLEACAQLTRGQAHWMLLTCHTPGFCPRDLAARLGRHAGTPGIEADELYLQTSHGRRLASGAMARWSAGR